MVEILDFERSYGELQDRIQGLKTLSSGQSLKIKDEIQRLEKKSQKLLMEIYSQLTPWQKVLVARHPCRPKTKDYIQRMVEHFVPLSGDKCFGEDLAIIGGLASFRGHSVMIIGNEKGHDTSTRIERNFGMAHPEGYRKAIRLMDLAQRFKLPVITLVDTAGAYAGTGAEERGQSYAIAACIEKCLTIDVPILSVIIGEGGSGGAISLATANHVAMLEHSIYSVISPEGCASILWRTSEKKEEAAAAQKLTAQDLLPLSVIDAIIPEPLGGAHRSCIATVDLVADHLEKQLQRFKNDGDHMQKRRYKFLAIGQNLIKKR